MHTDKDFQAFMLVNKDFESMLRESFKKCVNEKNAADCLNVLITSHGARTSTFHEDVVLLEGLFEDAPFAVHVTDAHISHALREGVSDDFLRVLLAKKNEPPSTAVLEGLLIEPHLPVSKSIATAFDRATRVLNLVPNGRVFACAGGFYATKSPDGVRTHYLPNIGWYEMVLKATPQPKRVITKDLIATLLCATRPNFDVLNRMLQLDGFVLDTPPDTPKRNAKHDLVDEYMTKSTSTFEMRQWYDSYKQVRAKKRAFETRAARLHYAKKARMAEAK